MFGGDFFIQKNDKPERIYCDIRERDHWLEFFGDVDVSLLINNERGFINNEHFTINYKCK